MVGFLLCRAAIASLLLWTTSLLKHHIQVDVRKLQFCLKCVFLLALQYIGVWRPLEDILTHTEQNVNIVATTSVRQENGVPGHVDISNIGY